MTAHDACTPPQSASQQEHSWGEPNVNGTGQLVQREEATGAAVGATVGELVGADVVFLSTTPP